MAANLTEDTVLDQGDKHDGEDALPLVFQCNGCRCILGDSFSWVCADQNLRTVSLSVVTPFVRISTEDGMEISTEGEDLGSTFIHLKCTTCQTQIGRMYKTTPKQLDMIRDVFTLDCSNIKSYQLGSRTGQKTFKTEEEILDIPTAQTLHSEILKVQSVVVTLNERIHSLESVLSNERKCHDSSSLLPSTNMNDTLLNERRNIRSGQLGKSDGSSSQNEYENRPLKPKRKRQ